MLCIVLNIFSIVFASVALFFCYKIHGIDKELNEKLREDQDEMNRIVQKMLIEVHQKDDKKYEH